MSAARAEWRLARGGSESGGAAVDEAPAAAVATQQRREVDSQGDGAIAGMDGLLKVDEGVVAFHSPGAFELEGGRGNFRVANVPELRGKGTANRLARRPKGGWPFM